MCRRIVRAAAGVALLAVLSGVGSTGAFAVDAAEADACPPLTFSPPDNTILPTAFVGNPYSQTITVSGGSSGKYFWQVRDYNVDLTGLSSFPDKGSSGSAFRVTGTPTTAGTYFFSINVWAEDASGKLCETDVPPSSSYTIVVQKAAAPKPQGSFLNDFPALPFAEGDVAGVRVGLAGTKKPPANMKLFAVPGHSLYLPGTTAGKELAFDLGQLYRETQNATKEQGQPGWYRVDVDSIDESVLDAIAHLDKAGSWPQQLGGLQTAESDLEKALREEAKAAEKLEPKPTPILDGAERDIFEAIELEDEADAALHAQSQHEAGIYLTGAERALQRAYDTTVKAVDAHEGYLSRGETGGEIRRSIKYARGWDSVARHTPDKAASDLGLAEHYKAKALAFIDAARSGHAVSPYRLSSH